MCFCSWAEKNTGQIKNNDLVIPKENQFISDDKINYEKWPKKLWNTVFDTHTHTHTYTHTHAQTQTHTLTCSTDRCKFSKICILYWLEITIYVLHVKARLAKFIFTHFVKFKFLVFKPNFVKCMVVIIFNFKSKHRTQKTIIDQLIFILFIQRSFNFLFTDFENLFCDFINNQLASHLDTFLPIYILKNWCCSPSKNIPTSQPDKLGRVVTWNRFYPLPFFVNFVCMNTI